LVAGGGDGRRVLYTAAMLVPAFVGQDRFVPRALVGAGEFGAVYEVWDAHRGEVVAAKVLRRVEATALARFKVEFRLLADLRHPNLVQVMELHGAPERGWFFTMPLLAGRDPVSWLRQRAATGVEATVDAASLPSTTGEAYRPASSAPAASEEAPDVDAAAVAAVFAQIVAGVGALHEAGLLHRDLKPSNVMVSPEGIVTILDFGVARTADDEASHGTVGTPRYMAPERWRAGAHGPASDWYAVGVMLHEVLFGVAPARGDAGELQPSPHAALRALCARLLARDPADRPELDELEAAFSPGAARSARAHAPLFVGRRAERDALVAVGRAMRAGARRTALVLGPSGVGKTALVRRALRDLAADGAFVALTGRCLEHETLPFKAVDAVVDALGRYLAGLDDVEVAALLPRHTSELAQVFPTLTQVGAVAAWPARHLADDPVEVRRRAFRALADLLGSLHDRTPVVVFIDDLQWGDAASARLLIDVLSGADAPGLMFLGACRHDERAESPFLAVWDAWTATDPDRHVEVVVDGLSADEALALSRHLAVDEARAAEIAAAAVGSPMLVEELVRSGAAGGEGLPGVIRRRLEALSDRHAAVLEAVVAAQRPLHQELLWEATGLDAWSVVDDLVGERLLRRRQVGGRLAFEVRHDRYRDVVSGRMTAASAVHAALARAGARQEADAEWVAARFEDAGEPGSARTFAVRAATEAMASLALERAAALYAQALRCSAPDDPERPALLDARGDALALVGRSLEAAQEYQEGAARAPAPLRMRYKASIQQICGGHNAAGAASLRAVSEAVGVGWPASPWRAVAGLMWTSFRLLGWRAPRPALTGPVAVDAATVSPIDLCWDACQALSSSDWIRGAWFAAQGADHALRSGDPVRIGRSLAWLSSQVEPFSKRQSDRALGLAKELAVQHPDPLLLAVIDLVEATRWLTAGHFAPAVPLFDRSVDRLERECVGAAYLGLIARSLQGETFIHVGDLPRLRQMVETARHRYWELGNAHGSQVVRLQDAILRMAADAPDAARGLLDLVARDNPTDGFFYLHYGQMENAARLSAYQGDVDDAIDRLEAGWPAMMASGIVWVPSVACRAWSVRGNLYAARLRATGGRDAVARARVDEAIRKLGGYRIPQAIAERQQLLASRSVADGQRGAAVELARDASARFAANHQHLRAAVAARTADRLAGDGNAGAEVFVDRGVAAPDRWCRAFAPALAG
jgi:tetratricopeptide (TPR) repeat protein